MLSQTAEYALRALACLALEEPALLSAAQLAERTQAPVDYLAKVLQQLASAELIQGKRGVGGGYRLARPAAAIRLLDALNAVAPLQRIERCPLGLREHGANLCPLHRKMDEAIAAVIAVFEGVTLADIVNAPEGVSAPLCEVRPATLRPAVPRDRASHPD
ncbi:MAG: Rrf2 family transcriptional regulator [Planctomycetota bacterium]|nr:MAG: Rrf2 family transcriptional regulator [Planctomycetota bacterium]